MTDTFTTWLAAMSKALGYPREADLARALDLPQSTVLRWRRGSRPSIEHLARLSTVLRTDLVALLKLAGHIDPGFTDPPDPPAPRTETERRIDDAALPDPVKERLRGYLAARTAEEDARVRSLISHCGGGGADAKTFMADVYATTLPFDIASALADLAEAGGDLTAHRHVHQEGR